ncbi:hypothetical protein J3998_08295 [Thiomicrorhabdus sp. 6S2-11]|uniref:Lipocalin-like domain-containing protein n=1 Tax=Thiomicrorhabdus marina TaxID=2818442 RepID=A0ABS3Q693_9GAMM|nr:hypothetical protein [Thiomicrorhabdus marina]MBO1927578.1 hypothetical protein [Thiomicrorhabdus marina]
MKLSLPVLLLTAMTLVTSLVHANPDEIVGDWYFSKFLTYDKEKISAKEADKEFGWNQNQPAITINGQQKGEIFVKQASAPKKGNPNKVEMKISVIGLPFKYHYSSSGIGTLTIELQGERYLALIDPKNTMNIKNFPNKDIVTVLKRK